jgi:riboflavin kinase/FMN adenylyltransferase
MQHFTSLDALALENAWLTVGVFDGVHRGHQAIIGPMVKGAHQSGDPAAVLTFDPHPAIVLGHRAELKCLTTPIERAELLGSLGVDFVITLEFTRAIADTSAGEFMARLKQRLGLKELWAGYDFALGKDREGNASRLTELGQQLGYQLRVVEAIADESGVISSTTIRKLVATGDVAEAARLLGRYYRVSGPVIHADGRGRRIGVPTANLEAPEGKVIPGKGIYACWAQLGQERYMAAVNIGTNPTFTPDKQTASVEAYLLDFDGDLYGQVLGLEFVARLRDELRFTSVEALVEQIWKDVARVREILEPVGGKP